jgi:multiple sugar transport system substrate-binding protein
MTNEDHAARPVSRRRFLKAGVFAATATSLAACGAPATTTTSTSQTTAPAEGAAAPSGGQTSLRLTFWGDLADLPTWNAGLDQFKEVQPTIAIQWENTPWTEYWTKLQTEMAAGTPPDVTGMVSMYAQQYIRQDSLLALDEYIARDSEEVDVDDFWAPIMEAYRWDGKTYAFPYDLSTMLLMYNKKLFDDAGVPYPTGEWTWDAFLEACTKLTKEGQWGYQLPSFDWTIHAWLSTNKAEFISADGKQCRLDTPEAIETVQFLADLRNEHRVAPSPAEQGDIPLFETGKVAITWGNPEAVQNFATRIGPPRDNPKFQWDVALIPKKQQNGNALAGGSFAISKGTSNPDQAWTFLKFYTSAPLLESMVGRPSRGIPGRRSVAQSLVTPENPEHQQFFLDVIEYPGTDVLAIPTYQQAIDIMRKYLDQVMLGQMTAADGMPKVVAELNPVLAAS